MRPTFRRAESNDHADIVAMMRELYASDDIGFPEVGPAALELLLREPRFGHCELICDGEAVIGYFVVGYGFSLEFGGRDAFLDELFINPDARAKGVGRAAVARAIKVCREAGVRALHLEVNCKNVAAQRLYRGAGFTPRHSGYDLLTLRLDGTTNENH